jgi:hypothetical protein
VIVLLVTASPVLEWAVSEDPYVPFGNILTWLALIALPMSLYFGIKRFRSPKTNIDRFYRMCMTIGISLGVLWYPVTWYLADNFSGSFGGNNGFRGSVVAGEYFWSFTYLVTAFPLFLLMIYQIERFIQRYKRSK